MNDDVFFPDSMKSHKLKRTAVSMKNVNTSVLTRLSFVYIPPENCSTLNFMELIFLGFNNVDSGNIIQ